MTYSLTYRMQTGEGCRFSQNASEAVRDYALLCRAGGSGIVISDGCMIVTLAAVTALGKLEPLALSIPL